ncbi:hypothetical protein B0O99DRAFT_312642 [Bisporella sp. PMI_857]|nr:hypothetical protein B0O99DRAFT_312642 [Bisporella sp. PMI_857]
MASFGIMDALNAVVIIWGLAVKLKEEGKELATIEKEIRKVKQQLAEVENRMKNPKHPLGQASGKMKSMIEEDAKDISDGCKRARELFEERGRMHKLEFGSKLLFITFRIPTLKDIVQGFHQSTSSIDKTVTILLADAAERAAANEVKAQKKQNEKLDKLLKRKDSMGAKLDKILAGQQKQSLDERLAKILAEQKKERLAREEHQKNTEKLLKLLEKYGAKAVENAALGSDGGKKQAQEMVEELVKEGVNRKDAKRGVNATLSAVRNEKQSQESPLKKARTIEAQKGEAAKPTDKNAPKAEQPFISTAKVSILCVDGSNGARSIIAQTYLELMRVWTMNTQKRWLFHRVDSAGLQIPTTLTLAKLEESKVKTFRVDRTPSKVAIDAIAGDKSHFQTIDPDEKGTILKRMQDHKSQGMVGLHFLNYEHIICFDMDAKKFLEELKDAVRAKDSDKKVVSKIYCIKECAWFTGTDGTEKETLLKLTGQLKVALKKFARTELRWGQPAISISAGMWRSLQFSVSKEVRDALLKDKETLIKKIMEKKECRVLLASDTASKWLVTISGPKAKLDSAKKMVEAKS